MRVVGQRVIVVGGLALALALLWTVPGYASSILVSATSGDRAATALFEVVGNDLQVTLTNASTVATTIQDDVLTGLFFELPGIAALTRTSAILGNTSVVIRESSLNDPPWDGSDVGGEWGYLGTLVSPLPTTHGISSVGMDDVFGPGDRFNSNTLHHIDSLDGGQMGIVSALTTADVGGSTSAPNQGGGTKPVPYIRNSVVFTLSGLPDDFVLSIASLGAVHFNYGSGVDTIRPTIPGDPGGPPLDPEVIPEPATFLLLGMGVAGIVARRMRMGA